MMYLKNEPQTAEEVLARARETQRRISAQRKREPEPKPKRKPAPPPMPEYESEPEPPMPPMPHWIAQQFSLRNARQALLMATRLEDVIIRVVARHYKMRRQELKGINRCRRVVVPRQIAMWIARRLSPVRSLPRIARAFGGRDHTTVLHAIRRVESMCSNAECRQKVEELAEKCKSELQLANDAR